METPLPGRPSVSLLDWEEKKTWMRALALHLHAELCIVMGYFNCHYNCEVALQRKSCSHLWKNIICSIQVRFVWVELLLSKNGVYNHHRPALFDKMLSSEKDAGCVILPHHHHCKALYLFSCNERWAHISNGTKTAFGNTSRDWFPSEGKTHTIKMSLNMPQILW